MLKSVIFNNRILHPSAITIAPSVADIFLTVPETSTNAPARQNDPRYKRDQYSTNRNSKIAYSQAPCLCGSYIIFTHRQV